MLIQLESCTCEWMVQTLPVYLFRCADAAAGDERGCGAAPLQLRPQVAVGLALPRAAAPHRVLAKAAAALGERDEGEITWKLQNLSTISDSVSSVPQYGLSSLPNTDLEAKVQSSFEWNK